MKVKKIQNKNIAPKLNLENFFDLIGGAMQKGNRYMKKNISLFKTAIIAALAGAAGYIAFAVPDAVESMVTVTDTIYAEVYDYCPTVTAKGTIIKREEKWYAVVGVKEEEIAEIKKGQSVRLSGAALPDGKYTGTVTAIGDTAYSRANGASAIPDIVVDVTVALETKGDYDLRSGYSVTAQLKTGEEKALSMLPYTVICQDDEGEYVYLLQDGVAVRREIETGIELSDMTEIVSGLNAEDRVLTCPETITEGERVRTRKNEA